MKNSNKKIQYPAPQGLYKVCVNKKTDWSSYNSARIHISVGKDNFESEKFFALCEWVSHRFQNITIIFSDTLQRYNFAEDYGLFSDQSWHRSLALGDEWLLRNQKALDLIEKCDLIRWNSLLQHEEYFQKRMKVERFYNENEAFREKVNNTVEQFLIRNNSIDPMAEKASLLFLLEELAAFSIIFKNSSYLNIYPGTTMEDVFNEMSNIDPEFPVAKWLQVDFTRNKAHPHWKHSSRKIT